MAARGRADRVIFASRKISVRVHRSLLHNGRWRSLMGDKGKKDKEKGQKQHAAKDKQEEKRKLEKQPRRTA
jgi:hypothetical protein